MQKRGDCFRCLMLESHRCRNQWIGDKPCPDGMQFEEYIGSKVKQCIGATMELFQDGYMHCPILNTEGMGCEWCMEQVRADKSFFHPDPNQNYEKVPKWRDQNKIKEDIMTIYFTKCGKEFNKSTNAETTGYHIEGDEHGAYDGKCAECPFIISVKEGWGDTATHKRWECRAGSKAPNHTTDWTGRLDDKCTISIRSINHDFCESVITFAKDHPDLGASYTQDGADCRRHISVSCSGNKKGMAAKQELIGKFFPDQGVMPDETFESEVGSICGNCENYDPTGEDLGLCELTNKSVSRVRPGCEDFDSDTFEEELDSMDLEDQLDVLLESGDKADNAGKTNGRHCGDCNVGHWYSHENTYISVVQDDGIKTVKRPCEPKTHYCYQVVGAQRKIAVDKDFDPDTAPEWCPLGEVMPPAPKKKPRSGSQGCQEMRENCPCFCAHNDGCAVLIMQGSALKGFIDQCIKDGSIDCEVFQKISKRVSETPDFASETAEIVIDQPESVPDVIEPAEVEQAPAFDYSELEDETASFLQEKAKVISQIKVQTVHDIGFELSLVHNVLANHKSGTFGPWCESIGISRRTAENYIQAYEYIAKNFRNIEDAAGIKPSLLFAASKPSAPPELAQAVIDGDITKHKDYLEALERIKKLNQTEGELRGLAADLANDKTMLELELKEAKKTSKEWHSAYDTQRNANQDLRKNADPEKLQDLIKQHEAEIADLKEQLNQKPIEVAAAEIREVFPEELETAWKHSVESAIKLISSLTEKDLDRIIRIEGKRNYAYMKDGFRLSVMSANENMDKLGSAIFSAPAPAAEFMKWLES